MTIALCVLLWANEGEHDALIAYEDDVLVLLADHGGTVVERVRTQGAPTDQPFEVQVIEFATAEGFDGYMVDPRRAAMAERRDRAIARTEVLRVDRH